MQKLDKIYENLLTAGKRNTQTPERSYVYKMESVEE